MALESHDVTPKVRQDKCLFFNNMWFKSKSLPFNRENVGLTPGLKNLSQTDNNVLRAYCLNLYTVPNKAA